MGRRTSGVRSRGVSGCGFPHAIDCLGRGGVLNLSGVPVAVVRVATGVGGSQGGFPDTISVGLDVDFPGDLFLVDLDNVASPEGAASAEHIVGKCFSRGAEEPLMMSSTR